MWRDFAFLIIGFLFGFGFAAALWILILLIARA